MEQNYNNPLKIVKNKGSNKINQTFIGGFDYAIITFYYVNHFIHFILVVDFVSNLN